MASYWCPGCDRGHTISFGTDETWQWDGNAEHPTFSPSILVYPHQTLNTAGRALLDAAGDGPTPELTDEHRTMTPRCHSFVREGRIQYLDDCDHTLAGQTVDMVTIPDAYAAFLTA